MRSHGLAEPSIALTVVRAGDGAQAVRALRKGDIVVVLYDLPRRFGRTVEVGFFGRRAHVVRGPAELAVLGHADVLPLFTHYDADGISVTCRGAGDRRHRVAALRTRGSHRDDHAAAVHDGGAGDPRVSESMVALVACA